MRERLTEEKIIEMAQATTSADPRGFAIELARCVERAMMDAAEQSLGLYAAQAEAIRELLDKHAPHTTGNLQTRVAQVLTGASAPPSCAFDCAEAVAGGHRCERGTCVNPSDAGEAHGLDLSDVPVPRENSWQRPTREVYEALIADTQQAEDAAGGVLAAGGAKKLPRHKFWGAGEPDCLPELKGGNGELHTMRCKVCGDGWRKSSDVCLAAVEVPELSLRELDALGQDYFKGQLNAK